MMKDTQYTAQLIQKGKVIKTMTFTAPDEHTAYKEANDGINHLSGQWVSVTPVPTARESDV